MVRETIDGSTSRLSKDGDEMLDVLPVQLPVVRTVRPKYRCRASGKADRASKKT